MSSNVTSGFYNSLPGPDGKLDRLYDARDMCELFDGIITDGILTTVGEGLATTASTGMTVIVGTGKAWFNNSWTKNPNKMSFVVPEADAIRDRIDAIVIDIDQKTARRNDIIYVKGIAATDAKRPMLINDSSNQHYQYALSYITVPKGATSIANSNIVNAIMDGSTPVSTGALQKMNIADVTKQWDAEYRKLLDEMTAAINAAKMNQIVDGAVSTTYTAHITPQEWRYAGDGLGYICEKNIPAMKDGTDHLLGKDNPIVGLRTDSPTMANLEYMNEAWSLVYNVITQDDTLILYAKEQPSWHLDLSILCIRK